MQEWILYNGTVCSENELPADFWKNRAFLYGDSFFESFRVFNNQILHFDDHFERILAAKNALQIPFSLASTELAMQLQLLVQKSGLSNARIRLQIVRTGIGFYHLKDQNSFYIAQISPISHTSLHNPDKKKTVIYVNDKKEISRISAFKTPSYLFTQAGIYAASQQADDAILVNSFHRIVETTTASIYIVKKGKISTPSLQEGCVNGIFRAFLKRLPFEIEEKEITMDAVLEADEVFTSNAVQGIQSVEKINDVTFADFFVAENLKNEAEKLFVEQ